MNGPKVIQLGRMEYGEALLIQRRHVEEVLANRAAGSPQVGRILLVEHHPVITVSRRAQTSGNLIATEQELVRAGVAVHATDRGGDITYHGPGQLVVYPILDLNVLGLKLVEYIRLLETVIIETVGSFGINAHTEAGATGVWVGGATKGEETERRRDGETKWGEETQRRRDDAGKSRSDAMPPPPSPSGNGAGEVPSLRGGGGLRCAHEMEEATERRSDEATKGGEETQRRRDAETKWERQKGTGPLLPQCLVPGAQCLPKPAKIAAIGVRVRRWVTMHGFALNVDPNLAHFDLIVPCGLEGRAVTSMRNALGKDCPALAMVSARVVEVMEGALQRRVGDGEA